MASRSTLGVELRVTHISTATAILDIDGVKLITDPAFDDGPISYEADGPHGRAILTKLEGPALALHNLPHIDGVLLSHEDHVDNLDPTGRRLLDGRTVITTLDGCKNLQPRPDVHGLAPWESRQIRLGGKDFRVTATPCVHMPGGECTGFILENDSFGSTAGQPNAIYFSGDTVYMEELAKIREKWHVCVAILNLGGARVPENMGGFLITMDGKQASQLVKSIGADIVVPMHYKSWEHFCESGDQLANVFEEEGLTRQICWLEPSGTPVIVR